MKIIYRRGGGGILKEIIKKRDTMIKIETRDYILKEISLTWSNLQDTGEDISLFYEVLCHLEYYLRKLKLLERDTTPKVDFKMPSAPGPSQIDTYKWRHFEHDEGIAWNE